MLAYRQAIEHRPDDWHPHARLAVLFDSDGDQLAADREAAQTVALSGGDPAAGQVLAAMRRGVIGP
jgi:Flp pilus assembly protein TadD